MLPSKRNSGFGFIEILLGLLVVGALVYFMRGSIPQMMGKGSLAESAQKAADATANAVKNIDSQNRDLKCQMTGSGDCAH